MNQQDIQKTFDNLALLATNPDIKILIAALALHAQVVSTQPSRRD